MISALVKTKKEFREEPILLDALKDSEEQLSQNIDREGFASE